MGKKPEPGTVRVNVVMPRDLEVRFRDAVYHEKGMRKGDISETVVEAVEMWLDSRDSKVGAVSHYPPKK